jgi:hypothetical protein
MVRILACRDGHRDVTDPSWNPSVGVVLVAETPEFVIQADVRRT